VTVAGETKVNVQKLKDVGVLVGYIVDEHKAGINDLGRVDPNAGKFDAGQWVRDLFVDRRDAIVTHMKYLERSFGEIRDGLIAIASEFEKVDSTNADAMAKFTASAKSIVTEMGRAEYQPVGVRSKTSYESGDDAPTTNKDTFDFSDRNRPKILDFDPRDVPGMGKFMTTGGLGTGNDKTIDLNQQADVKGDGAITLDGDPPATTTGHNDAGNNGGNGGGNNNGSPTGAGFSKTEPAVSGNVTWNSDEDYNQGGKTYRYYEIDGAQQTDASNRKVWWTNGEPYVMASNGQFSKI
jgi:hypothetical protein